MGTEAYGLKVDIKQTERNPLCTKQTSSVPLKVMSCCFVFFLYRTRVRLESLEDCRVLEDPNNDSMSDTHGCPAYVSPEILSGSAPYSGKMADMWSLGVMLYTMLVGRYPFHDPDPATLFSKIRRGQCCLPEGLSPKAKCLLHSLLRKEPCERLTATELLAHPWFQHPLSSQEVALGEQEVSSAEQMVPSFDVEEDDNLFCWQTRFSWVWLRDQNKNCSKGFVVVFLHWHFLETHLCTVVSTYTFKLSTKMYCTVFCCRIRVTCEGHCSQWSFIVFF